MTWFKVCDDFATHQKVGTLRKAGGRQRLAAIGLWTVAGSACAHALGEGSCDDGFISREDLEALAHPSPPRETHALAALLVGARLWQEEPGGYRFHDWSDRQPSSESVRKEKDRWRESKQKSRGRPADVPPGQARESHRESTRESTPCPETPVPVPVPSERRGASPPSEASTMSRDAEAVRVAIVKACGDAKMPLPRDARGLTGGAMVSIGQWCRERATIDGVSVEAVAERLATGWATKDRAEKPHPFHWLLRDPSEYWTAPKPEPIDPKTWNERHGLVVRKAIS